MARASLYATSLAATGAVASLGLGYWFTASQWSQQLGPFPYRANTDERVIALTFDDGPNEPYTSRLADVLAKHDVRATFFQPGACATRFPDTTRRLAAEGHTIGNHSYHHDIRLLVRRRDLRVEIERTQEALTPLIGGTPALYRPPWLFRHPGLFAELDAHGLRAVGGEFCHPSEVFQPDPQVLVNGILQRARPGLLLVCHDGYNASGAPRASTVSAIDAVIPQLKDRGYRFATADELLGWPKLQ